MNNLLNKVETSVLKSIQMYITVFENSGQCNPTHIKPGPFDSVAASRGPAHTRERDNMVRQTRFSFDDGMDVNFPPTRDSFDEIDDDLFGEQTPATAPSKARKAAKRARPDDHRPDRRHLAGADWTRPERTDDRRTQPETRQ